MPTDPSPESVAALAEALDAATVDVLTGSGTRAENRDTFSHRQLTADAPARILSHPFTPAQRSAIVAALLPVEELAAALIGSGLYIDAEDPLVGPAAPRDLATHVLAALRERGA